jgi:hypothetical protein
MTRLALKKRQHVDKLARRRLRSRMRPILKALQLFARRVQAWWREDHPDPIIVKDPIGVAIEALSKSQEFGQVYWNRIDEPWINRTRVQANTTRPTRQEPIDEAPVELHGGDVHRMANLYRRYIMIRGERYAMDRIFTDEFLCVTDYRTVLAIHRMMAQAVIRFADAAEQKQREAQR